MTLLGFALALIILYFVLNIGFHVAAGAVSFLLILAVIVAAVALVRYITGRPNGPAV